MYNELEVSKGESGKLCFVCGGAMPIDDKRRTKYCSPACGKKAKYAYRNKMNKVYIAKFRSKVRHLLGDKCKHCGITDTRVLQIDHINGGGYREMRDKGWSSGNVLPYLKHILSVGGQGYQLLCANCNWIKRYEQKEAN